MLYDVDSSHPPFMVKCFTILYDVDSLHPPPPPLMVKYFTKGTLYILLLMVGYHPEPIKNALKRHSSTVPYWNSLPSDVREAKSESQFKKDLKTHLFKSHLCI